MASDLKLQSLISDLPDAEGARLFLSRLSSENPHKAEQLMRNDALLSDALALAAWSPFLATTLTQHPDYFSWLARERIQTQVKTLEELKESLARLELTNSQIDPQVLLARFRRRELLRIYLRDIRRTSTLVDVMAELSNLADAILEHALSLARQDLDNRFGGPSGIDEKGRTTNATFCVMALGKLGSGELNYASDIDLLFIYSDEGSTSGRGSRGEVSNREYFVKLASAVARMVGSPSGEGAAYRVDLRLRPYGRDGALASSIDEAVRYYNSTAQAWERQMLIRSRAAAGSAELYSRFAERVVGSVYASDVTVRRALEDVRLAKQKIDRHHAGDARGYNVKLGRGGIREIEFIAQALQLAFGGRDPWLRASHTLISLGRLADRRLVTEKERVDLSGSYSFLRTLEHRLQMDHGLQTHSVPEDRERRALIARRMNFTGAEALDEFDQALRTHRDEVRAVFERVFGNQEGEIIADPRSPDGDIDSEGIVASIDERKSADLVSAEIAASVFARRIKGDGPTGARDLATQISAAAHASLNSHRALSLVERVATSLEKSNSRIRVSPERVDALTRLCGTSEYFGEMIAGNPNLISAIPVDGATGGDPDYRALLIDAVTTKKSFRAELSALRNSWSEALIEIGSLDAAGTITMFESNRRQTALAGASLDAGCLIARRELERRHGNLIGEPRLAILGLGRLGGEGVDFGSDLDVVFVYDDERPQLLPAMSDAETYARFGELLVAALASLTRDGYLYRVDLRLRPHGKNGPSCTGARTFIEYMERNAQPWEWLAYVKLRAAGGALDLSDSVEIEARRTIHEAARRGDFEVLRSETRRVRERIEIEKSKGRSGSELDIKYGRGGMLDVYFALRYLQLRDGVPDEPGSRSTRATLARLRDAGSLNEADFAAMNDSYILLRTLDHNLRLIVGRSTRLPASDHPSLRDIAVRMSYESAEALKEDLETRMNVIRETYERIMTG